MRDIAFTDKVVGVKELFEMFNKIISLSILSTIFVRSDFSPFFPSFADSLSDEMIVLPRVGSCINLFLCYKFSSDP